MVRDTAITNNKAATATAVAVVVGWDGEALSVICAQYFTRVKYKICLRLCKINKHECN